MMEDNMITRLALAALISAAAAGSAFALIPAGEATRIGTANETIIPKTQAWEVINTLTVEECATETCEDNAS
jgi:hypothetical protein